MKKIFIIIISLITLLTLSIAKEIDITKAKGTQQDVISSLYPTPASPEVDANTTIKAVFNEALNPVSTLHSITLKLLSGKKKKWSIFGFGISRNNNKIIKGSITYEQNKKTLHFIPEKPLEVGFYEVSFKHLMKMLPGINMRIKPIVYRFYVPEVINGFKLPPKPDEDKNNATLLGIDFNHNGIRDDVERWIIHRYANDPKYPKTKTAIALQDAWASQKILENPTIDNSKYEDDALACEFYWFDKETVGLSGFEYGKFIKKHKVINTPELEDKIFNTKKRILRMFEYNRALSGNILTLREDKLSACRINIDEFGE